MNLSFALYVTKWSVKLRLYNTYPVWLSCESSLFTDRIIRFIWSHCATSVASLRLVSPRCANWWCHLFLPQKSMTFVVIVL